LTFKYVHNLQYLWTLKISIYLLTSITFLKLACSELTYKEVADKMCLSPKTIDGYRNNLFVKLNVKNRVGLVMYAIKNKIYTP